MKIGLIPDLHGRDTWKGFVQQNPDLHFVFLGDYTDSYDLSNEQIITNLLEVIEFKKNNPNKVTLLLGNHDVPYFYLHDIVHNGANIPSNNGTNDGEMAWILYGIFSKNKKLFSLGYQIGKNLFTHAGVSEKWYKKHEKIISDFWNQHPDWNLADVLNGLDKTPDRWILFQVGKARGGRDNGGIVWSCREETKLGTIKGYRQFVGHTRQESINTITFDKNTSITYCDVLTERGNFMILDTDTGERKIFTI